MLIFCYNIGDFYDAFKAYFLKYVGTGTLPETADHPLLKSVSPDKDALSLETIASDGAAPIVAAVMFVSALSHILTFVTVAL